MPRSLAKRLRGAQKGGAILTIPNMDADVTVVWDPRQDKDPLPWLGTDGGRYKSWDIIPVRPEGVQVSRAREKQLRSGPLGRMSLGLFPYPERPAEETDNV